jgi:integration host factor subunit beta
MISKYPLHNPTQMIRSELIAKLADKHFQLKLADVELAVKTILEDLANRLAKGGRVEIRGFGSFSVHTRPLRLGRNPRTGEAVKVPERTALNFRAGTELKERVNIESENKETA